MRKRECNSERNGDAVERIPTKSLGTTSTSSLNSPVAPGMNNDWTATLAKIKQVSSKWAFYLVNTA